MKCIECPYIKDEFHEKIEFYKRCMDRGYEKEFPTIECLQDMIEHCECEKLGWELGPIGTCEKNAKMISDNDYEAIITKYFGEQNENNSTKENIEPEETKIQKKRIRDEKYKGHLRQLWNENKRWFSSCYPCDSKGSYAEENSEDFVRYKRVYNPRRAKFLRRIANKKVRKSKNVPRRGGYKKVYDYVWELW